MEKILLIIDDSKEVIDIVQEIVGDLFDKVVSADSVEEAQKKIEETHFSFIVLDIKIGPRNGAEVVKYLVENPNNPNNGTPVVILSGIITPDFVKKFGGRFAGVVMKPFDHEKFVNLVKHIQEHGVAPEDDLPDLPTVGCSLPFPIPELEQKVAKAMELIKKNTRLKQLFADLKVDRNADNYILTHVGMLINISSGISIKMEWNTEKTLEKFIYASYLHDMALLHRPDLARYHGNIHELNVLKETIPEADFKLIHDHSTIAAQVIDELKEIPPDVGMMVRQHHELPKEMGFPGRLAYNKITPLATIFIVAHDLTDYIFDHPQWTLKDYMVKAKLKFKGPHFMKVLSALGEMG